MQGERQDVDFPAAEKQCGQNDHIVFRDANERMECKIRAFLSNHLGNRNNPFAQTDIFPSKQ